MSYLIVLSVLALGGCAPEQETAFEKLRYETEKASRENCLKRGGVVIESKYDFKIKDCLGLKP